jgi:hypothetical protein
MIPVTYKGYDLKSQGKYPAGFDRIPVFLLKICNLWKKHLAGAEEISDHRHAPHERTLDDVQRSGIEDDILARLLCVLHHKLVDSCYIKK